MARYGKETTLPPRRVLRLAREFFGPTGEVGLALTKDTLSEIGFAGGGGGVEVQARPRPDDPQRTDVTILAREYDAWAVQFLHILSAAERGPGLLARFKRRFTRG